MKIIKGDLVLTKNTEFKESIKVEGCIKGKDGGRYDLKVSGDIDARDIIAGDINAGDINAWDINARNINARNIDARNIDAWDINARDIITGDINARDINARNIICISIKKKSKTAKIMAFSLITDRFSRKKKEFKV